MRDFYIRKWRYRTQRNLPTIRLTRFVDITTHTKEKIDAGRLELHFTKTWPIRAWPTVGIRDPRLEKKDPPVLVYREGGGLLVHF
jgi:hypothetical protein